MRLSQLRPRDLIATFLVAVAAVYFGLFKVGVRVSDLGSVRAVAAVVLFLGLAACAVGGDPSLFKPRPSTGLLIQAQKALGYAALVIGLIAIAFGSELMLTVLFATTAVLWTSSTLRHLARQPIESRVHPPKRGVHV